MVCMAAQGSDQGLTLPEVAMAPNEWAQKAYGEGIFDFQKCSILPVQTFHLDFNYIHYIIMIFILYKLVGAVCP